VLDYMRTAERDADNADLKWTVTLHEYLDVRGVPDPVRRLYVVPMAGALWSLPEGEVYGLSARRHLLFMKNHGLLSPSERFRWCHVAGGSVRYIDAAARRLGASLRLSSGVVSIRRRNSKVEIELIGGVRETFDAVVLATHGDVTRELL